METHSLQFHTNEGVSPNPSLRLSPNHESHKYETHRGARFTCKSFRTEKHMTAAVVEHSYLLRLLLELAAAFVGYHIQRLHAGIRVDRH